MEGGGGQRGPSGYVGRTGLDTVLRVEGPQVTWRTAVDQPQRQQHGQESGLAPSGQCCVSIGESIASLAL